MSQFLALTVVGVVTGCIYALSATGVVVTYATTGIFNFANGAFGAAAAFSYWHLRVQWGWPAPIAAAAVLCVGAPTGGLLLHRLLRGRARSNETQSTLIVGIGLLLCLIGLLQTVWSPVTARVAPPLFGGGGLRVAGVTVTTDQLAVLVVTVVVAVALRFVFSRTTAGVAMRAAVDDRPLLALYGVDADRLAAISWMIGTVMASAAGILLAPLLSLEVILLSLLVIDAFAAAVAGRLTSVTVAFAAAIGLGLFRAYSVGYLPTDSSATRLKNALPALLLLAVVSLVPDRRVAVKAIGTIGRVSGARGSLAFCAIGVVGACAAAALLPDLWTSNLALGVAYGLIMLSLVVLTGWAGEVSLCQMTFVGLGAFTMARVAPGGSVLGVVAAAGLAAAAGAIVALPAARLRGLYLALSTLAFAMIIDAVLFADARVFRQGNLLVARPRLPGLPAPDDPTMLVMLSVVFAGAALGLGALLRGRTGRLLTALRDSPAGCSTLGLDVRQARVVVFAASAAMAGAAGALFGGLRTSVSASDFSVFASLPVLLVAVLLGARTPAAALAAGMALALFPSLQRTLPEATGFAYALLGVAAVANSGRLARASSRPRRGAPDATVAAGAGDAGPEVSVGPA